MATRKSPRKRAAASTSAQSPEPVDARTSRDRLLDAALVLAERQGWRRTSLAEIVAEAGLTLAEAYALCRSKPALLAALIRRVDAQVLAGAESGDGESPRERLFDTLMRRFDALAPHKAAIRAILRDSRGDPTALLSMPPLLRSMSWMLEAAGISSAGYRGHALVHLTLGLYLSVLRVFLTDDSADLAQTMAALDRGLKRGASLCSLAGRRRGAQAEAA